MRELGVSRGTLQSLDLINHTTHAGPGPCILGRVEPMARSVRAFNIHYGKEQISLSLSLSLSLTLSRGGSYAEEPDQVRANERHPRDSGSADKIRFIFFLRGPIFTKLTKRNRVATPLARDSQDSPKKI